MNTSNNSPLYELFNCFKSAGFNLFPNKTVFYNCLFHFRNSSTQGSTNDIFYSTEIIADLQTDLRTLYESGDSKLELSRISQLFYKQVADPSPEVLDTLFEDFYPSLRGDKLLSNKENKTNCINGVRSIPNDWKNAFQYNPGKRYTYVCHLAWILQYLFVFHSKSKTRKEELKDTYMATNYIEYYSLPDNKFKQLSEELKAKELSESDVWSFFDIADVIYSCILEQCTYCRPIAYAKVLSQNNLSHKSSLDDQLEFYNKYITAYGTKNIDRFNILKRYAEKNVYCANELGNIYYYGDWFLAGNNKYYVECNYELAAQYYQMCCNSSAFLPYACWSFGHMILNRKIEVDENLRLEEAAHYFNLCGDYGPAQNSLALIEKELGDTILTEIENGIIPFDFTHRMVRKMKDHYTKFMQLAYAAGTNEWLYGYNNLYHFLTSERHAAIVFYISHHRNYVKLDKLTVLKKAASTNNPWAMDKLACEYISLAQKDSNNQKELLKSAKKLLKEAHEVNYHKATYHLAIYFYKDTEKYIELLELAAQNGYKEAQEEVVRYYNG